VIRTDEKKKKVCFTYVAAVSDDPLHKAQAMCICREWVEMCE
jgi:hypothetical protein